MIATILDTFSDYTFSKELVTLPLSIKKYKNEIEENANNIDFVFVESVWRGNGDQWFIGRKKEKKRHALAIKRVKELTTFCKKLGIPTVFWGKEDPVNFSRFVDISNGFDYIFTTDEGSVARYKRKTSCKNIAVLPFAAQPKVHKFRALKDRRACSGFAGTNYPNKKRRECLNTLLSAASEFDLNIYDRGRLKGKTTFKDKYEGFVVGGVPYKDLIDEYSKYRVFLNVDTIQKSKTMFSRRVFELLCCGTPVISFPSTGVDYLFKNIVISSRKQEEIKEYIKMLFVDDAYWRFKSVRGMREVYRKHTIAHRLESIYNRLGIKNLDVANSVSKYEDFASKMEI